MDIELAKKVAIEAVKEAGKVLLDNIESVEVVAFKAKSDIVTKIDLQSEKIVIGLIKASFPDHAILSEEAGFLGKHSSEYLWIMDPIDGTINYYHGMNPFRVGLCLLKDKQPILTVVYNPTKDDLYFAEKGKGATLNGQPMKVSDTDDLNNSVVMTHLSSKKESRVRTIVALENIFTKSMQMRMFGSGLAAMCYIASGRFDVFFNIKTNPWDILPGVLLIEEAGGKVTDINGEKITEESTSIVASNGKVHDQILKLLETI